MGALPDLPSRDADQRRESAPEQPSGGRQGNRGDRDGVAADQKEEVVAS